MSQEVLALNKQIDDLRLVKEQLDRQIAESESFLKEINQS